LFRGHGRGIYLPDHSCNINFDRVIRTVSVRQSRRFYGTSRPTLAKDTSQALFDAGPHIGLVLKDLGTTKRTIPILE